MYSEKVRQEAITLYQNGTPVSDICSKLNIARSSLFLWIKQKRPAKIGKTSRAQYLEQLELERLRIESSPRAPAC